MPVATNQISARNQIRGSVADIKSGQVTSLVTVRTGDKNFIASITNEAVKDLGLKANDEVFAIVKASQPILIKGDEGQAKISARNQIVGHVTGIQKGPASCLVTVKSGDIEMCATITSLAVNDLQINNGDRLTVAFKASDVMLQRA